MQELIVNIAPNLVSKLPDFYKALGDTMLMVLWSGLISFVFGLLLGVVLTVTKPNGILENKVVYQILDKLVSLFRSIPFIILLTWVMPITRALVGTVLYVRGAIVPLVFGSVPFFTRQVESALAELDGGLIEAALSMGSSPLEIIFRVYLKESIAAIARGTTITIVSLLNLTAMAGVASGEHGIGLSKRPYFLRQTAKENLQAMNAIKTALDPQHILNNGKSYLTGGNNNAGTF